MNLSFLSNHTGRGRWIEKCQNITQTRTIPYREFTKKTINITYTHCDKEPDREVCHDLKIPKYEVSYCG